MTDAASLAPPLSSALDEETARAEVYGLLARLYYAVPDAELLEDLRVAVTEAPAAGGFLEAPWQQLVSQARSLVPSAEVTDLYPNVSPAHIVFRCWTS